MFIKPEYLEKQWCFEEKSKEKTFRKFKYLMETVIFTISRKTSSVFYV